MLFRTTYVTVTIYCTNATKGVEYLLLPYTPCIILYTVSHRLEEKHPNLRDKVECAFELCCTYAYVLCISYIVYMHNDQCIGWFMLPAYLQFRVHGDVNCAQTFKICNDQIEPVRLVLQFLLLPRRQR